MAFPNCENHRELLPPKVRLNTDDLAAQMQGFLGHEHHADGSHSDITADSIDTGPVTIVSDDWWISLERENPSGNRVRLARLTQAEIPSAGASLAGGTLVLLDAAGAIAVGISVNSVEAARFGVDALGGPEQQMFDALSVQERFKLYGQGTWLCNTPTILADGTFGPRYSAYALTAGSAVAIYGLQTQNAVDGARGQLVYLWNTSTFTLTFQHDAAPVATYQRLLCPGGVNLALPPQAVAVWLYDIAALRWRCVGGTFAATGGGAGGMNLDYLGNFVSGPVYNDGDIVIATDGIAYMCVVDGTTTPPEPWPGVGIATAVGPPGPPGPAGPAGPAGADGVNAAIDATYWTVSAHPNLTNERALNSLANGYVKSTAGEPSTVAVIPIADGGTGATTAPDARTNLGLGSMAVQNANAVAITGGTITAGSVTATGTATATDVVAHSSVQIVAATPSLYFIDASTDTRWQTVSQAGGAFLWIASNADGSSGPTFAAQLTKTGAFTAVSLAGNGAALTTLNASQLATGIANPARLGSGTADATTFLRGDGVWASAGGVPSGLIVLSDTPCPPGWTRVNWDGSFLRVNSTASGTGGAATHQHGAGTLAGNAHSHGGATGTVTVSGTTSGVGDHSHNGNVSGDTGATGDTTTLSYQTGGTNTGFVRTTHTHNFSASYTTNNAGAHSHTFSGSGTGSIGSEGVGISGQTDAQSNLPPWHDVILCRKN